jgi:transcriptional regulator with XRE-family HTH domain
MVISERLRALREQKNFSQGDIEERTGLLRCYISRVENGHTVPAVETLEKFARALEVPTYEIFYDGEEPPEPLAPLKSKGKKSAWGSAGKDARTLRKFRECLGRISKNDLKLLMHMAQKMAR